MSYHGEQGYLNLLNDVIDNGLWEDNRTGIPALTLPGAMLKFDLREGFPAVTTKKLAFNAVKGELIGFLRGCTSAAEFRELGCKVWDQNANENAKWLGSPHRAGTDDLGLLGYSHGWRNFGAADKVLGVDQIHKALQAVRNDPTSRRILVSAWNPHELEKAALPPCHVMFQLLPRSDGTLHMVMYQRSCDMFLGIPFNIASYALLLALFAAWTGRKAATLSMMLADVHIYENHMEQVLTQVKRKPHAEPSLHMNLHADCEKLGINMLAHTLKPEHIRLEEYTHHEPLTGAMAV
jgi:thymidylate synthase